VNPYEYIRDDFAAGLAIMDLDRNGGVLIGFDTETTGLDPLNWNTELRLVQLAGSHKTYVFDCKYLGHEGKDELRRFLERENKIFIAHNLKFDLKMVRIFLGVKRFRKGIDTFLAAVILACGLWETDKYGFGLDDMVQKHLGILLDKTQQASDWSRAQLDPVQIKYAARDAEVLLQLWPAMAKELLAQGQVNVNQLECDAVNATASLELNGFHLDPDRWTALNKENTQQWKEQRHELQEMLAYTPKNGQQGLFGKASRYINLNSPDQLINALLAQGIPVPTDDVTGRYTTAKFKMNALAIDYPIINYLRKYRVLEKQRSSYGLFWLELINPFTGRLHMDFKQIGAKTGRMAVSRIQQIPSDIRYRRCFTAEQGHALIRADYAQFELRILAELSQDPGLMEAFFKGLDLHQYTADKVGRPRSVARNMNYAIPYGSGPTRFSLMCEPPIPISEAKAIFDADKRAFPRKHAWLEKAARDAVKFKQSRTLSGRLTKWIYDPEDKASISRTERNGKNTPIQGLNADVTKRAMRLIDDELQGQSEILIVHVVHDEIILESVDDPTYTKRADEMLEDYMTQAAKEFIKTVPIKVDTHIASEWSK
jgi:DNA polymerase-1